MDAESRGTDESLRGRTGGFHVHLLSSIVPHRGAEDEGEELYDRVAGLSLWCYSYTGNNSSSGHTSEPLCDIERHDVVHMPLRTLVLKERGRSSLIL